jgi:hypothetical protein
MTTTAPHGVPIPAGFSADGDWEIRNEPRPFRLIWGPQHVIGGDAVEVRLSALPYHDGTIETDHDNGPAIHVNVCRDWGVSTKHAREVAAGVIEVDDWQDDVPQPYRILFGVLHDTDGVEHTTVQAAAVQYPDCVTSFVLVMPIMTKGTDTSWPTVSTSPSAAEFSRPHSFLTAALTPPLTGGLSPSPGISHPSLLFDTSGLPPAPLVAGPFFSPDS